MNAAANAASAAINAPSKTAADTIDIVENVTIIDRPIMQNEYVKSFLDILQQNDAKMPEMIDVIKLFAAVESDLNRTIAGLQSDIKAMRAEADHPLKTAWQKAANGLMSRLKGLKKTLGKIKDKIVNACKNMASDFKDKGTVALYNVTEFCGIKQDLERSRDQLKENIGYNAEQIAKIETLSAEFHAASRHIKNVARVMTGKEPIPDIKPNGKLAELIETGFVKEVKMLQRSLGRTNKMLAGLDRLEKAAERLAEQSRPSTLKNMEALQVKVNERKQAAPVKEPKAKAAEAEVA